MAHYYEEFTNVVSKFSSVHAWANRYKRDRQVVPGWCRRRGGWIMAHFDRRMRLAAEECEFVMPLIRDRLSDLCEARLGLDEATILYPELISWSTIRELLHNGPLEEGETLDIQDAGRLAKQDSGNRNLPDTVVRLSDYGGAAP